MLELNRRRLALVGAGAVLLLAACHTKPKPNPRALTRESFGQALVAYLAARGQLCLGKEFPIDVTERERELHARNAIQMPALEHLGLVASSPAMGQITSEDGPLAVPVTRYELTAMGRQYYRNSVAGAGSGEGQRSPGDLCVAKLSLDRVVSWELSTAPDAERAVVSYSYHIQAAPWTRAPEIEAVFPAVQRVIAGAENALLKEGVTLTRDGWVANELLPIASPVVAAAAVR